MLELPLPLQSSRSVAVLLQPSGPSWRVQPAGSRCLSRRLDGEGARGRGVGRLASVERCAEVYLCAAELLCVSGLITDGGLGPTMLVIPEGHFKRLAVASHHEGRPIYAAGFGMHPRERSRFNKFLIPTDRLVERFGISSTEAAPSTAEPHPMWRSDLGFLGEAEVIRLVAENNDLSLFRPFPGLETSELAALHLKTWRVLGLQIKTVGVNAAHPAGTLGIHASSFRPSPTTCFVVLAWLREERRFHHECLLIPSLDVPAICKPQESERSPKLRLAPRYNCSPNWPVPV
jgi:hypothetical protein